MSRSKKRLLLLLSFLLFLAIAPITLFYARGDRYNFSEGTIDATGGLFVVSDPNGSSILLDGEEVGSTKKFLAGLEPGTYTVGIEHDDYRSWTKTIDVDPYRVTQTGQINLVPSTLATTTVLGSDYVNLLTAQKLSDVVKRPEWLDEDQIFHITSDSVLFFGVDVHLYSASNDAEVEVQRLSNRPMQNPLIREVFSAGKNIFVVSESGTLYEFQDGKFTSIASGVGDLTLADNHQKVLWLSPDKKALTVLWLHDHLVSEVQSGEIQLVFESDVEISQVEFEVQGYHLLVHTDDTLRLVELDGRGGRNNYDIGLGVVSYYQDATSTELYMERDTGEVVKTVLFE